jgi:hypothetical protein
MRYEEKGEYYSQWYRRTRWCATTGRGEWEVESEDRFMKMGWAGENFPEASFPSLVGRPMLRYDEQLENIQIKVPQAGDDVELDGGRRGGQAPGSS